MIDFKPKSNTRRLLAILLFTTVGLQAQAQDSASDTSLRMATGPQGGVFQLIARDIQTVCGNVVPITAVPSKGGLNNLMMLSSSEADIGIAQIDTLQEMSKGGDDNIKELQAIMPLHVNMLHIVTLAQGSKDPVSKLGYFADKKVYRKFSDLKEARVALVGSAQLVGQTLEAQVHYGMTLVNADTDDQAVAMLLNNKVQAVFTTGGWPYPAITKHPGNSGLMLAEYDLPAQSPFTTVKRNYPNMGAYNYNFLAASNLLLTRPFKPNGERGKRVAALQNCIIKHLDEFQEGHYHAVWKEIKNPMDTRGVSRFSGGVDAGKLASR